MNSALVLLSCLASLSVLQGEEPPRPPAIQDNSFLVEEAYNQEDGVVQHISTFTRNQDSKDWLYTFTQEWPVFSQKHQFSFTLPWQRLGASLDGKQAFGDVAMNYRYQLVGNGEAALAVSPRFTVLLPTGDETRGYGKGATGFQVNLPVSFTLGEALVGHFNAGATQTPRSLNADGHRATTRDFLLGQSFIWLANPRFNVLLEYVHARLEAVVGPGQVQRQSSTFLAPGLRWSYNFPSGLQIVPGLALPIGVGASHGEKAIFFYLSFEHPFGKGKR